MNGEGKIILLVNTLSFQTPKNKSLNCRVRNLCLQCHKRCNVQNELTTMVLGRTC